MYSPETCADSWQRQQQTETSQQVNILLLYLNSRVKTVRYIRVSFILLQLDDALLVLQGHVKTLEDGINPLYTEQSSIMPPEDYLPDSLPVNINMPHYRSLDHSNCFTCSLHQTQ